ncbi:hypothetical protein X975_10527, partial [Stegodyphus mimosarum]
MTMHSAKFQQFSDSFQVKTNCCGHGKNNCAKKKKKKKKKKNKKKKKKKKKNTFIPNVSFFSSQFYRMLSVVPLQKWPCLLYISLKLVTNEFVTFWGGDNQKVPNLFLNV